MPPEYFAIKMATATSNLHSPLLMADTVPNSVDYNGRPAVRSKHGRWFSALFIIWVEMAERIAFYGISSNLISFLTGKLGQSTAMAAVNINAWSGVASLLPVFGAVIADSFAGKFYTIVVSSLIYILGLGLLTMSAMLPLLSCPNQGRSIVGGQECSPHLQTIIFFIALYLVAAGQERTQQLGQDIVPCAVEYKHRPAVRSKHGRWKSASIIIWVEMAERISYLTGKLGQSTAMAASSINAWGGIAALLPIIGAIIADSFIGKYYTIIVASFIYILIEKYTYQHSGMVHVPSTVLRKKVFQGLYKDFGLPAGGKWFYIVMSTSNSKSNAVVVGIASAEPELLSYTPFLMVEQQEQVEDTVPGAVDYKHRPAIRSKHGQWTSASFIIWVEMAERMAYYGISGNLISYLTGKLEQSTAMAASSINAWNGVGCLLTILGAVIADSFVGKYYTIVVSSIVYILGLGLLTLSATLPSFSCFNQDTSDEVTSGCSPQSQILFFVALYLVAVGQGGHKPCVQAFGADQFDGEDPKERKAKSSFFNWWYFGVCLGGLLGIGVLSYVQDNLSWGLGFGIPCIILILALLIFMSGTMTYRYNMKLEGESPFSRIGRVFVAVARHWNVTLPVVDDRRGDFEETEPQDRSQPFRYLNKALLAPSIVKRGVKACSKNDVKEAKAVLRLFPIWATTLVYAVVFSQPKTFFIKQGITLDRSLGSSFAIPAATLMSFNGICIISFIPLYDRVLVPMARELTGKSAGISMLQRIGIGLFLSTFTMIIAAVTEKIRLQTAVQHGLIDLPNETIPMRIWWLLPQYALFGISEAFTMIGLQEFFYDQVPKELRSVGLSLYLSILGLGGVLSSFLVLLIIKATTKGGGESWFSDNLNRAHLDYFYWLLAGLSAFSLALFMYFAKSYVYK